MKRIANMSPSPSDDAVIRDSMPRHEMGLDLTDIAILSAADETALLVLPQLAADPAAVAEFVLAAALTRPTASQVGRAFGTLRRLERAFARINLPPPHRLVVLVRWLPVARVLADGRHSTKAIAGALAFTTTGQFYKAVARQLHTCVSDLRGNDGFGRITRDILTAYGQRYSIGSASFRAGAATSSLVGTPRIATTTGVRAE